MESNSNNSPPAPVSSGWHQQSVDADALTLDATVLARGLGYDRPAGSPAATSASESSNPRPMAAQIAETAEAMLERGRELIDARWAWIVVPVRIDAEQHGLVCESPFSATLAVGRLVRSQLHGSAAVAAFVVTIGSRLEEEARTMMHNGDPLGGYVLDTVGSMAAEAEADLLEAEVFAFARETGHKITHRFSPGYCSWETVGQQALFSLFPSNLPAGVSVNQSSLLSPTTSVSGAIGTGEKVKCRPYPCDLCPNKECLQRLSSMSEQP